jgi:hypothetical protein
MLKGRASAAAYSTLPHDDNEDDVHTTLSTFFHFCATTYCAASECAGVTVPFVFIASTALPLAIHVTCLPPTGALAMMPLTR